MVFHSYIITCNGEKMVVVSRQLRGSRQMDVQARPLGSLPAEIVPQRFRCDTIRILKDTGFLTCAPLSIPGLHGRINRHTPFSETLNKRTG